LASFKKIIEQDINFFVKEVLNKNLNQEYIQIDFSPLTQQIIDEIATPEGIIYLYHNPNIYADQIRKIFNTAAKPKQLSPPPKEKPIELDGPNILRLWERVDYLFFTDFSHFKANFKIKNKPFTIFIIWERKGIDWKVIMLRLPLT
jgi:hypothetical protein